jgi:hypothetical protein
MRAVINIYRNHKVSVDSFIKSLINSLPKNYMQESSTILKQYRYIQLMYGVDSEFRQTTPIVCRRESDSKQIGSSKSHYFTKLSLSEDGIYISNPYIHYRTGKASLSVVYAKDNMYHVFDINLIYLLEELKLIEYNSSHDKFKRMIYFLASSSLAIVSLALIVYGGFIFVKLMLLLGSGDFLHDVFKSIISITLGLAIFDFARQIFEHEVIFESFHQSEDKPYKVLGKFLIAIIIALAIETLMVVFKIALDDHGEMLSAFYLLVGTTMLLVGLGYFYKIIKSTADKEVE